MRVIVKASQFNSPDHLDRIYTITEFVDNVLENSLYEAIEIDQVALKLYFIIYYYSQVRNNGILDFLRVNYMNITSLDSIYDGLQEIGAIKHKAIFQQACETLNMLDEDSFESIILTGDINVDDRYRDKIIPVCHELDELNREFTRLQKGEEVISDLLYPFIGNMKNISIVHDGRYDEEMEKLYSEVPDYEQRLFIAENAVEDSDETDISDLVADVCTKFNLNLISINDINFGENIVDDEHQKANRENGIIYCHITTEEGEYYIVNNGIEAELFEESNKNTKGSISIH